MKPVHTLSRWSEILAFAPLRSGSMMILLCASTAALGQNQKLEPMRGVNRGQKPPIVATLVIGINDAVGSIAEPGWPLIVSAVKLSEDKSPAISLPSNLVLKLTDENGGDAGVTLEPVPAPATGTDDGSRYWLAAESATTRLTPRRYRVSVVAPPPGWRIEPGEFQVVAPTPGRARLLGHLKIQRSVALGRDDDALAEAERLTATLANDPSSWIAKGDILMRKDKPDEALAAFDQALRLQHKSAREPLAIMTRRRAASRRSLEQRGVVTPTTPP